MHDKNTTKSIDGAFLQSNGTSGLIEFRFLVPTHDDRQLRTLGACSISLAGGTNSVVFKRDIFFSLDHVLRSKLGLWIVNSNGYLPK